MNTCRAWTRLAVLLFPVLVLCACAKPEVAPDDPSKTVRGHLGNFVVVNGQPDDGNMARPYLYLRNHDLAPDAEPVRELTASRVEPNFPLAGCESMKVEFFTGGANCCFGYYLLTSCPDTEFAAYVAPMDGNVGEPEGTLHAYPVSDPAFMYYSPEGQTGKKPLSFIRPDSPRLTRYIVFENGAWRADRPGEFTAAYAALADEAGEAHKAKGGNAAANAIAVAYYTLMAGGEGGSVEAGLKKALPKQYRNISATIFADINKAVAGVDPVRNMDLAGK